MMLRKIVNVMRLHRQCEKGLEELQNWRFDLDNHQECKSGRRSADIGDKRNVALADTAVALA